MDPTTTPPEDRVNAELQTLTASLISPGPKPGYQTTEFWVTVIITLGGLFIASGLVASDSPIAAAVTTVLSFLSTTIYAKDRVKLKSTLPPLVPCLLASVLCLLASGCSTALKSNKIITVKERVFGLVFEQSDQTQTPRVKIGFSTTVFQMVPTSTNGPINAPRYFDTFQVDASGNPFKFGVTENSGFGDVAVTTNSTGRAIIPTINAPAKPLTPEAPRL